MDHSIIIPHRGRPEALKRCLASLQASREHLRLQRYGDVQILVINHGERLAGSRAALIVEVHEAMPIFCKSRLLNIGLRLARGRVLSFLDADMVVGPKWLEGALYLLRLVPKLTRLCYRVRRVTVDNAADFDRWETYPRGYEAYTTPDFNPPEGKEPAAGEQPVFGNSQFSIRRNRLVELAEVAPPEWPRVDGFDGRPLLAYDEAYVGRGLQDLDYIQAIWRAAQMTREGYRALLFTDAAHGLLHLDHDYEPDWNPTETRNGIIHHTLHEANARRYREKWR